ncbi:hypothetical protein ACFYWN_29870 [Streptomyces sp. NPDC002917]|uniref:hypothetical protein n=1 Tax=Streptomyces sp. NPDC002917 TaxID=3364671 RepID=UPI00369EA11C
MVKQESSAPFLNRQENAEMPARPRYVTPPGEGSMQVVGHTGIGHGRRLHTATKMVCHILDDGGSNPGNRAETETILELIPFPAMSSEDSSVRFPFNEARTVSEQAATVDFTASRLHLVESAEAARRLVVSIASPVSGCRFGPASVKSGGVHG